jgi:hypothetical protein
MKFINFLFQHRQYCSTCHVFVLVEFYVTVIMCAYLPAFQHNHEDLCFIVLFIMLKDTFGFHLQKNWDQAQCSPPWNFAHVILRFHFNSIQCLLIWNYLNIRDQTWRYEERLYRSLRMHSWVQCFKEFFIQRISSGLDINVIEIPWV